MVSKIGEKEKNNETKKNPNHFGKLHFTCLSLFSPIFFHQITQTNSGCLFFFNHFPLVSETNFT